jgi:6-phosphogluconate dehydrogenase
MQLGMIGLGKMGANMVRRLAAAGHTAAVYDVSPEAVSELAKVDNVTGLPPLRISLIFLAAPEPFG